MGFLSIIGSLLAFVCGLAVLVKLFQKEGVLKGILGFICMLYTFIWGWQNTSDESFGLSMQTWMYIWTGAIILGMALNAIAAASSG